MGSKYRGFAGATQPAGNRQRAQASDALRQAGRDFSQSLNQARVRDSASAKLTSGR